jgi:acetyl esterase
MSKHVVEPAAQGIADATSKPPFLHELGPQGARKVLDDLHTAPIDKLDVDEKWITVPAEAGEVPVRIDPRSPQGPRPLLKGPLS